MSGGETEVRTGRGVLVAQREREKEAREGVGGVVKDSERHRWKREKP